MDSDENVDYEKEYAEYEDELESFLSMVVDFEKMGPIINSMINNEVITINNVASLESIVPGMLIDNYDINGQGGVFSPNSYTLSLEQTIATEMDLAMMLMGKFFKLNMRGAKLLAKSSAQLAGIIATVVDDKIINGNGAVLGTHIQGANKIPTVNFSKLPAGTKNQLTKLVAKYTGSQSVGEREVIKVIETVKSSKNGIEIMSKVYMPRYSNLLIPIFYIPNRDYKDITRFFRIMDEDVLPKVDTNLNTAIMQLQSIMSSRDWVSLSKFDTRIFTAEDKAHLFKLAENVRVTVKPNQSYRKVASKTYAGFSELLRADKKGLENDPKYHQSLTASVKDLGIMKDHIISISDTMSDMSKHSESRTGALSKDLRRFRASKTIKESFKGGRNINKYSNAVYSRVMREMKEVAILSSFMAQSGRDVLNAYTGVYTRSNKLNSNTVKFIEQLNKILGEH